MSDGGTAGGESEDGEGADGASTGRASEYVVVLVGPETPGNVGTVARAMKNFGLADLLLVDPPELTPDGEAYGFAGHAREDVLPNAKTVTFDEVVETYHTVGCTAITGEDARRHVRFPFRTPAALRESLAAVEADTALVFGREGRGLNNDELARLDEVCSIPASAEYPVLNLGQAATVTLYELRDLFLADTQLPDVERERAAEADIERLYGQFDAFLDAVEHREHKRERTERLVRRLVGRAHPTEKEVSTLTGVFRKAARDLAAADLARGEGELGRRGGGLDRGRGDLGGEDDELDHGNGEDERGGGDDERGEGDGHGAAALPRRKPSSQDRE